jgi:hypothetical protein
MSRIRVEYFLLGRFMRQLTLQIFAGIPWTLVRDATTRSLPHYATRFESDGYLFGT